MSARSGARFSGVAPALLGGLAGEAGGVADLGPGGARGAGVAGGGGEFVLGVGGGVGGVGETGELGGGEGTGQRGFPDGGAHRVAGRAERGGAVGDDGFSLAVGAQLAVAGVVVVAAQRDCQRWLTRVGGGVGVHDAPCRRAGSFLGGLTRRSPRAGCPGAGGLGGGRLRSRLGCGRGAHRGGVPG